MVVAPSIYIRLQRLQSPPPPPPPGPVVPLANGAQPLMIAAGDNLPDANVNESNPAGVNQVPNAGDEAANNGGAVDDPANNDNGGVNFDEHVLDLHQSSASDSDFSDNDEDSEEDKEVGEAGR